MAHEFKAGDRIVWTKWVADMGDMGVLLVSEPNLRPARNKPVPPAGSFPVDPEWPRPGDTVYTTVNVMRCYHTSVEKGRPDVCLDEKDTRAVAIDSGGKGGRYHEGKFQRLVYVKNGTSEVVRIADLHRTQSEALEAGIKEFEATIATMHAASILAREDLRNMVKGDPR